MPMPDWRALSGLCAAGRLDPRQVAIGRGISGPPQPLVVRHHGRPATRLPGGASFRVGLLLRGCRRRCEANDAIAIDAEVGGLAGRQRTPGTDGVRLGLRLRARAFAAAAAAAALPWSISKDGDEGGETGAGEATAAGEAADAAGASSAGAVDASCADAVERPAAINSKTAGTTCMYRPRKELHRDYC